MDFQSLKNTHPHKERILSKYEKDYKLAKITLQALENIAIQRMVEDAKSMIEGANSKLINKRSMTDIEREGVFATRDSLEWFVKQFENAENTIKAIENKVKKYEN